MHSQKRTFKNTTVCGRVHFDIAGPIEMLQVIDNTAAGDTATAEDADGELQLWVAVPHPEGLHWRPVHGAALGTLEVSQERAIETIRERAALVVEVHPRRMVLL